MADQPRPSAVAAGGIWLVSLVGSWLIGLAVLGSLHDDLFGCGDGSEASGFEPVGDWGWVVLVAAAVTPILVMVAAAPPGRRARLIGLSVVAAVFGLVVGTVWFGACL